MTFDYRVRLACGHEALRDQTGKEGAPLGVEHMCEVCGEKRTIVDTTELHPSK